jgi:molybdenum cofactor synthesis domain-containing protein
MAISVGILTVSDKAARGERVDTAGPAVAALVEIFGAEVKEKALLPDEQDDIERQLKQWADESELDLVLTIGGTGLSLRDITPEATLAVADRLVPGIAEVMRQAGLQSTYLAPLSRAVAVTRGRTLIINLPGSERGARESLQAILDMLPHAVELLRGEAGESHPT